MTNKNGHYNIILFDYFRFENCAKIDVISHFSEMSVDIICKTEIALHNDVFIKSVNALYEMFE